jgi:hypothetical protein
MYSERSQLSYFRFLRREFTAGRMNRFTLRCECEAAANQHEYTLHAALLVFLAGF